MVYVILYISVYHLKKEVKQSVTFYPVCYLKVPTLPTPGLLGIYNTKLTLCIPTNNNIMKPQPFTVE